MDKIKTFKYWVKCNINHLKNGRISELNIITTKNNYWSIRSINDSLHGYEIKRLGKYYDGISSRMRNLASYFGNEVVYSIQSNDIIVDIGANIGEFSKFCLKKGAKVLSVEPDNIICECLSRNLSMYEGVLGIEKSVIADKTGEVEFYFAPTTADSSMIEPDVYQGMVKLNSITLNDLYKKYELKNVKLLKCDAEGAEPEVFAQSDFALTQTKYVAVDCGPERKGQTTVKEVSNILIKNNFKVLTIDGYLPKSNVIGININW